MKKQFLIILSLIISITTVSAVVKDNSLPLLTKVIYIDPGHGGRDQGTSYGNILEKDLNLEISLKLKEELTKEGAIVFLTRESDIDLSTKYDTSKKRGDLSRRIKMIEDSKADLYISIHMNWFSDSKYGGIDILYNDINEKNKKIAQTMKQTLETDFKVREIKQINDYLYRNIKTPGVLIECGFLSNNNDRYLLQQEDYQTKLAKKITKSLINYFTN